MSRTIAATEGRGGRKRAPNFPGAVIDQLILDLLGKTDMPLGAYDLAQRLEISRGLRSVMPIYRSIERLSDRNLIERVESISAYRLRDVPKALLMICTECGATMPLPIGGEHDKLRALVMAAGFSATRLVVEAIGRCGKCPRHG